jgi:cation-transporting ATPase 13A2
MWSNGDFLPPSELPRLLNWVLTGWLMFSLIVLTLLNLLVLLSPLQWITVVLDLMIIPFQGRTVLLWVVIFNVIFSLSFERWGVHVTSKAIGIVLRAYRDRQRIREDKTYKLVENGGR